MNYEITVTVGETKVKTFMQEGFLGQPLPIEPLNVLHSHSFAELHTFLDGDATMIVEEQSYEMKSGDIALVPKNRFHIVNSHSDTLIHRAFQVDLPNPQVELGHVSPEFLADFAKEASVAFETDNVLVLSAYFTLLISGFLHNEVYKTQKVSDYTFLISEFFSRNYKDNLRLSDLAEILCVSDKQAERLVVKHTGKTFVEMLTSVRMDAAKQLMTIYPTMPLSLIAQTVGYHSYSGFWKAYKRYEQNAAEE